MVGFLWGEIWVGFWFGPCECPLALRCSLLSAAIHLFSAAVQLFVFLLTESHYISVEEKVSLPEFSDLIFASGGSRAGFAARGEPLSFDQQYVYSTANIAEIEAAGKALNAQISSFHLLKLELPENVTKPRRWKLEVVDSEGKKRKDRTVTYPHELEPCVIPHATSPTSSSSVNK